MQCASVEVSAMFEVCGALRQLDDILVLAVPPVAKDLTVAKDLPAWHFLRPGDHHFTSIN